MARKVEAGIDYYPCNTDHVTNRKIKLLISKFDSDGFWIYECIKCECYRVKGYFMSVLNEEDLILFAQDVCKKPYDLVKSVIQGCLKLDLFDNKNYKAYKILTSDRIQENYCGATNRRSEVKMIQDYLLIETAKYEKVLIVDIEGLNVSNESLNVSKFPQKDDSGTQRKEKESKVKEIGEREYSIPPDLFKKLFSYLKKNTEKFYPNERIRATNEMMEWQEKNSITETILDTDPEMNKKNQEQIDWLFKKHMGRAMTLEIENCYNHYARTDFMIDGQKIKAWIPVLSGWMNRRDNFKKKSA